MAGGAALGTAVAGGVLAGVGQSQVSEWDSDPGDARLDELEVSIPRNAIARNVMFGTAGALAATAAVLFFLEGRGAESSREKSTARFPVVAPAVGAPGLVIRGSF